VFFYVIQWLKDRRGGPRKAVAVPSTNGDVKAHPAHKHAQPAAAALLEGVTAGAAEKSG
jgi:hypothetical protein